MTEAYAIRVADALDRQAGVEIRAHDGTFLLDPVAE